MMTLKKKKFYYLGLAVLALSLAACGDQKTDTDTKDTASSTSTTESIQSTEQSTDFSVDKGEITSAIVKSAQLTFKDENIHAEFNDKTNQLELNLDEAAKNDDLNNNQQLKESIVSDAVGLYESCEKDFGVMYPIVGIPDGKEVFKIDKGDVVENHL